MLMLSYISYVHEVLVCMEDIVVITCDISVLLSWLPQYYIARQRESDNIIDN